MGDLQLLAQFATFAADWEAKYTALEDAVGKPEVVKYLAPHLDALEHVYAEQRDGANAREDMTQLERRCALAFLRLWETKGVPRDFLGLMEATVHLWMSTPPVPTRAKRIAAERSVIVIDCFGTLWHPTGVAGLSPAPDPREPAERHTAPVSPAHEHAHPDGDTPDGA